MIGSHNRTKSEQEQDGLMYLKVWGWGAGAVVKGLYFTKENGFKNHMVSKDVPFNIRCLFPELLVDLVVLERICSR